MKLHGNARLTAQERRLLVERVCDQGFSLQMAADAAGVSRRTASKWVGRRRDDGAIVLAVSGAMTGEAEPLAVLFHEEDPSIASGLRFGRVEVFLRGHGWVGHGLLPWIGARALARGLGVPLLDEQRQIENPQTGVWRR